MSRDSNVEKMSDTPGTALVSGYSQNMLRLPFGSGGREKEEDLIEEDVTVMEIGEIVDLKTMTKTTGINITRRMFTYNNNTHEKQLGLL